MFTNLLQNIFWAWQRSAQKHKNEISEPSHVQKFKRFFCWNACSIKSSKHYKAINLEALSRLKSGQIIFDARLSSAKSYRVLNPFWATWYPASYIITMSLLCLLAAAFCPKNSSFYSHYWAHLLPLQRRATTPYIVKKARAVLIKDVLVGQRSNFRRAQKKREVVIISSVGLCKIHAGRLRFTIIDQMSLKTTYISVWTEVSLAYK